MTRVGPRDLTEAEFLHVDRGDDGVAVVTMDRPPVNAVSLQMYREIHDLFSDIDRLGPGLRAVVLTGAGRHFSAGNDLDDFATMTPQNARERMFGVRESFFAIQRCPVPVIGAVGGVALGTGLALAASCDFVVAASDAQFGLPELSVGVMGGARHLGRLVGQPLVRWMFLTGQRLSADDMERRGAVIRVVDRADVLVEALVEARRIAQWSPTAVRLAKQGLDEIEFLDTFRGYELEQGLTVRMTRHPDSKAALDAARTGEPAEYEEFDRLP